MSNTAVERVMAQREAFVDDMWGKLLRYIELPHNELRLSQGVIVWMHFAEIYIDAHQIRGVDQRIDDLSRIPEAFQRHVMIELARRLWAKGYEVNSIDAVGKGIMLKIAVGYQIEDE